MQIWDIGGQDKIRKLWCHYFNGVNAIIFVVDSSDTTRLKEAAHELKKLTSEDQLRGVPVLVYANKQDLPEALEINKIADSLNMHALRGREWHVQASSASLGRGLYEGLEWLNDTV
eukprot:CAMPEP_0168535012 /NCGR_PEP_ID=MMETSP0405-20121227/18369_1 /TAXON_ID=498012 /ORGANISM="Trichosphaerium sp, Strain Am-I-7 wt" /LENGTH=115 /DNA_ID=CAMNT_0008562083 /DNA_START=221 /DNA_END=565 /DNA_ORIENTATION=+